MKSLTENDLNKEKIKLGSIMYRRKKVEVKRGSLWNGILKCNGLGHQRYNNSQMSVTSVQKNGKKKINKEENERIGQMSV